MGGRAPSMSGISMAKKRYQTLLFWEDELDDSGMSKTELKIRVQDRFWFLLLRNETRVDQVFLLLRIFLRKLKEEPPCWCYFNAE